MKTLRCFLLVAIFIYGCASTAKYEAVLYSWLGSDINLLVDSWGYPDETFDAPNGNRVYVYVQAGSYNTPMTYQTTANAYNYGNAAYVRSTAHIYDGQTLTFWCKTFFEVNSSNKIVRWRWQGNNCRSK